MDLESLVNQDKNVNIFTVMQEKKGLLMYWF